ncbi:MAG: hypothetical protein QOI49_1110 [Verrucomicrobiota bacterium]
MSVAKQRDRNKTANERFYRCPGCGQMVDNQQREAVFEHHDHVLRPPPSTRFLPVTSGALLPNLSSAR